LQLQYTITRNTGSGTTDHLPCGIDGRPTVDARITQSVACQTKQLEFRLEFS
jgi:hypothetical protein